MAGRPLTRARMREAEAGRIQTLTETLGDVLTEALKATSQALKDGDHQAARNYATAVAVLADRYHLRSGLPTSASVALDADKLASEVAEGLRDAIPDPAKRERIALRLVGSTERSQTSPERLDHSGQNGAKAS